MQLHLGCRDPRSRSIGHSNRSPPQARESGGAFHVLPMCYGRDSTANGSERSRIIAPPQRPYIEPQRTAAHVFTRSGGQGVAGSNPVSPTTKHLVRAGPHGPALVVGSGEGAHRGASRPQMRSAAPSGSIPGRRAARSAPDSQPSTAATLRKSRPPRPQSCPRARSVGTKFSGVWRTRQTACTCAALGKPHARTRRCGAIVGGRSSGRRGTSQQRRR